MPASLKELDRRIRSVKNTQQITRAMKMVAAAKLRRAQDKLIAARPYGGKLEELLDGLAGTSIDNPLFEERELRRRYVVVVSSDKGLCGSYNATILREAELWLKAHDNDGVENVIYAVGRKANDYFKRRKWKVETVVDDLGGVIDVTRFNHIADDLMHPLPRGRGAGDPRVLHALRLDPSLRGDAGRTASAQAGRERRGSEEERGLPL